MRAGLIPSEILGLIIGFLPQWDLFECAVVNRRFNATTVPLLWRTPNLTRSSQFAKFIECLYTAKESFGSYVRRFAITHLLTDDECLRLIRRMPLLEELVIENSPLLTDKSVSQIATHCSRLEELHLHKANITYRSAHYLGGCRRLRKLTLRSCERLLPITLLPFLGCQLEYLDLSGCKWLNVSDTVRDLQTFSQLKHLDLVCSDRHTIKDFMAGLVTDDQGAPVLPNLTSFSITGHNQIDDDLVTEFVRVHPHLRDLTLMECAITDISLRAIQHHLPRLQFLDISYCPAVSAEAVRTLIEANVQLDMIGLKGCGILKTHFPEIQTSSSQAGFQDPSVDRLGREDMELVRMQMSLHPVSSMDADIDIDDPLRDTYAAIQHSLDANLL